MKRFLSLMLVFLMILSFAFGGGTGEASDDGKIDLRVSWWGGDARHEKYRQMLDHYEELHPEVNIIREFAGFDGYFDKLTVQAASGSMPDVVHMHLTKVADYASRGALLPLDEYVESGIIDLSEFNQAIIDSGKVDGKIYMVSLGNSITGMYVNETRFTELGFDLPDNDWTWDECLEYCKAVQAKLPEGHYVLQDGSTSDTAFDFFLRQRGKSLYTVDGKLGFEKQDMVDFLNMWKDFRDAGVTPPMTVSAEEVNDAHGDSLFVKEVVLMKIYPANQLAIYQGYMTDKIGVVRVPGQGTGMNGEFVEGAYISIGANSKHPEEAAKVINYLLNDETAVSIFGAEHGALGSAKMNEFIKPQLSEANQIVIDFTQYASQFSTPRNNVPAGGAEVNRLQTRAAQSVGFGTDVNAAVDEFFDLATTALK